MGSEGTEDIRLLLSQEETLLLLLLVGREREGRESIARRNNRAGRGCGKGGREGGCENDDLWQSRETT